MDDSRENAVTERGGEIDGKRNDWLKEEAPNMCTRVTITLKPCVSDGDSNSQKPRNQTSVYSWHISLFIPLLEPKSEKNDHTRIITKASLSPVNIAGQPQIGTRFGDCVIIFINCGLGLTVQTQRSDTGICVRKPSQHLQLRQCLLANRPQLWKLARRHHRASS